MRLRLRSVLGFIYRLLYGLSTRALYPLNYVLSILRRGVKYDNSVLHISYMVHIPYYTVRILRKQNLKADYLAIGGKSPWWDKYDYHFPPSWPPTPWQEFFFFWSVVAKYEVIHSHFAIMFSATGWELPHLKRMGRKIVVNYRGCEIRDPAKIRELHADLNMCELCDYDGWVCRDGKLRVSIAKKYGDLFLVTTPDMREFVPGAIHFPFFAPSIDCEELAVAQRRPYSNDREIKIVHVTNHPGIEGTDRIKSVIERLQEKGHKINFVFLRGVPPGKVLEEFRDADLTIGKMKMGYYANAQIESMVMGIPAITYVCPEFMTEELRNSGFIFSHLDDLEQTLEYYLTHPEALEEKRRIAHSSILRLHNNEHLAQMLVELYRQLKVQRQD